MRPPRPRLVLAGQLALELTDPLSLEARLLVAVAAEFGQGAAQHRLAPVAQRLSAQPSLAQEAAQFLLREPLGVEYHFARTSFAALVPIAGKKLTKNFPQRFFARQGWNVKPRKSNFTCSCSPLRSSSLQCKCPANRVVT